MSMTDYLQHRSWEENLKLDCQSDNGHHPPNIPAGGEQEDVIISRPPAALTARPASRCRLPTPTELTPPPSPQREHSPNGSSSEGRGFSGLLTRTLSINGKRPTLPRQDRNPLEPPFQMPSPSRSERSVSPTSPTAKSSPHVRRASTFQVAANFLGINTRKLNVQATISEEDADDPFSNLDIEAELIPQGTSDKSTVASFDSLFANAERVILRMQAAYRMKCDELHKLSAAHGVEQEELEEARTRASHLKFQLDGMSTKVCEQDEAMKSLVEELVSEKFRHGDEECSRRGSMHMMANPSPLGSEHGDDHRLFSGDSRSTMFSLQYSESDSGDESSSESVFSRSGRQGTPSNASLTTTIDFQTDGGRGFSSNGIPRTFAGLREENLALRARVAELEETVECCLGLFDRPGA